MIALERRKYILEALNNKGVISLKSMAKELQVAEITIYRDFEKMEAEGKLKRVQGGAELPEENGAELTMSRKMPIHNYEKKIIAKYAASLVNDGDSIFIDGGTTMIPLATELFQKNVKIITYNTLIINKVINPVAHIILIGGNYVPHYNMNVGPIAQDMLKNFYFDHAFLGCAGIDLEKKIVFTTETESLIMKQLAMNNAKHNYLLSDCHKFSTKGFFKLCDISEFESVITNSSDRNIESMPENILIVD